jgi:hypothetical protein
VVAFLRALAAGPKGDVSKLTTDKDIGLLSARIAPLMSNTYALTHKLGLRGSPLFYGTPFVVLFCFVLLFVLWMGARH